jgi:cytochrome c oxidase assembly protein subunit 15|tara:strand:- start:2895 stop:3911 length:1017 start_codon:yes stop_codon:yes gene_type:complete
LKREDISVIIWLIAGCLLVFMMVIVGGITRLTDSGLSMVDWNLFSGAIPPINQAEWIETFNQYKQYPEYQKQNFMFTLSEFKTIFFWEYIHRLLGRFIGLVFIIPFIYFLIKKRLSKSLIIECCILLFMGGTQGAIGWWMVKSGLVNNPDVSHFRLAIHLITAFLTFSYTFWVALKLINPSKKSHNTSLYNSSLILMLVVVIQIIYGAFVAGLDAGKVYNSWPKMHDKWIAESVYAMEPFWSNFINGIAGVQFIHRTFAFVVLGLIIYIYYQSKKYTLLKNENIAINLLMVTVLFQMVLGIITLVMGVPLWLGVLHQVGAFILLASTVFSIFIFKKIN